MPFVGVLCGGLSEVSRRRPRRLSSTEILVGGDAFNGGCGLTVRPPGEEVDSWAGPYPSTPDQHPIIDRTDAGMVVVGGFAGAGLMHAPAAALVAAESIVDGRISSIDADAVSLARFSKATEPVERTGF